MPFKGIHGHTRHTHEDKVEEKKPHEEFPKKKANDGETAVKKEVDLYNTPFEPFTPSKPAHYMNRFWRRSAQTVVHCALALSPHFYMHTDELFDWMMPYERMGALLSEDAEDYINRKKHLQKLKEEKEKGKKEGTSGEEESSLSSTETDKEKGEGHSSSTASLPEDTKEDRATPESKANNNVSSIFSCEAVNPRTDHEMQVNPKNPKQAVAGAVSHFHPPFLIIDSRREDEYKESHIHGAVNIHYIPPNVLLGHQLEFSLPDWVEKDTPIITYCAVGLRSGLMVWELRRRGYRFVKVLSGGYYKWVNEGRPIYAHTGELTEKVLQQHKLAGIMLRKELKAQKKNMERKQALDERVASHHKNDTDWPECHTYKPCPDALEKRKSILSVNPRRKSSLIRNDKDSRVRGGHTSGASAM